MLGQNTQPELYSLAAGKLVWSSEDLWSEANWPGAACWAKTLNQNLIRSNLTDNEHRMVSRVECVSRGGLA